MGERKMADYVYFLPAASMYYIKVADRFQKSQPWESLENQLNILITPKDIKKMPHGGRAKDAKQADSKPMDSE